MKTLKSRPQFPRMTDPDRQGVCEVVTGAHPNPLQRTCFKPAMWRYPAMGGGYLRLCAEHGEQHREHSAEWLGVRWSCGPWEAPEAVDAVAGKVE